MYTHQAVLLQEAVTCLNIQPEGIYVDGTFGRGGHSRAILSQLSEQGRLIGLDQDPEAVAAGHALAEQDPRFQILHSDFASVAQVIAGLNLSGKINGFLLDLGVSSPQLDDPERGFSFMRDGALDMRMNPTQGQSLTQWLKYAKEREIVDIIKRYGEERHAKRITRAIVTERDVKPIETTAHLADIVAKAHPAWEIGKHPATKTFQALRIFINQELEQIETVLPQSLEILAPQGRLAVISFHSLEDRLVKRFIREEAKGDDFPAHLPVTVDMLNPKLKPLGKAIYPSETEMQHNPRARSAVLRAAERLS
ncbi:16S rRNA (cytosine(1402)-N(4))-methyltransferase RsmH [Candidatus Albibeggiatoa sp. nov. BB20]|uniref:16S rRNA (cytosine(1402)-N(4))-methyltransferase RsmH n=1 Tax=Candidatus Albibeggiatoa sp. nov. BB20 TaxID=3162723 RepID=UPI003365A1CC